MPFSAPSLSSLRPARSRPATRPVRVAELAPRHELPELDSGRKPWPGQHHSVGAADLFVRKTPASRSAAEPALYLHGLGGASTNFTDVAGLLSPWLSGEALDLPGFGRSGPSPTGKYSIAAHTQTVIAYLDQSGRGPVHLIGNSMGGAISILLASTRPDLVRTLTLISPAVPDLRPKRPDDLTLPLLLVPGVGSWLLRQTQGAAPQLRAKEVIELCFAHPELVPEHRLAEAAAEVAARRDLPWADEAFLGSLRGIAGTYLSYGARSPWRVMAGILAPTVVIWGELDGLVDVSRAPLVAAAIDDATLLVLPDVGHTAQLEDPVSTARAVLALLRRGS